MRMDLPLRACSAACLNGKKSAKKDPAKSRVKNRD